MQEGGAAHRPLACPLASPPSAQLHCRPAPTAGVLVSPGNFAASWTRKFWFNAVLSLTAFACMMSMLGTGKDAATYGVAPF